MAGCRGRIDEQAASRVAKVRIGSNRANRICAAHCFVSLAIICFEPFFAIRVQPRFYIAVPQSDAAAEADQWSCEYRWPSPHD
jgi:hypothetical protein